MINQLFTPFISFFQAVSVDRKDVVKFLIASKARSTLRDIFGLTPLCIAKNQGHTDLLDIMCPSGNIPQEFEDNEFAVQ